MKIFMVSKVNIDQCEVISEVNIYQQYSVEVFAGVEMQVEMLMGLWVGA